MEIQSSSRTLKIAPLTRTGFGLNRNDVQLNDSPSCPATAGGPKAEIDGSEREPPFASKAPLDIGRSRDAAYLFSQLVLK